MRYLKSTQDISCCIEDQQFEQWIMGFIDSNFVGDHDRIKSLIGYMFMLNGYIINQKANLQNVITMSKTKAEYTAALEVMKEVLWLKGLMAKLEMLQKIVEIHCDSSNVVYLSENPTHYERTKHIDVKFHL